MAKAKTAVPEGYHTVTPVLTLDNCAQAIDCFLLQDCLSRTG